MKNYINHATIIDVRSPGEFEQEHYPGAINIPIDELQYRIDEVLELPTPIITYCKSGARSSLATSILMENGIADVYNGGGLQDMFEAKNLDYVDNF